MQNANSNTITVGLCAGRHDLPVDGYIFKEVENVFDFAEIERTIWSFLCINDCVKLAPTISGDGYLWVATKSLIVYVTGLTTLTAAVIKMCAEHNVPLTLMHFDRASGDYIPQKIF